MTHTRWAVDDPDGVGLELDGRKFSSDDEGAPMMCNIVCTSMGRHVHIDYCRAEENGACEGGDGVQHIKAKMVPDPNKPKDAVTHSLYWRRMGSLHYISGIHSTLNHHFARRFQRSQFYFSSKSAKLRLESRSIHP